MSIWAFPTGVMVVAGALGVPQDMPPVAQPAAAAAKQAAPEPPIVPDAEFDAALPPLSNDLNAPLEPILPLTPATTGPPPVSTSPGIHSSPAPETSGGQDQAAEAPAPPELTQPLPALAEFNATPPVDLTKPDDGKTVVIRYETVLRGLDGMGLGAKFNGLSALKQGDGKAPNATVIAARAREDEALAVRLMKSEGYYDGTAISTIEPDTKREGRVRAIVSATPGKQYKLGEIKVVADATTPPGLVEQNLPLRTGDAIEADRVQGAEANVALTLPQRGYPFVKVGQRDILLDDATGIGDYTLPVVTGPRASFGTFTTEGRLAFGAEHIAVLTRFKPGELYDNRKVDDLRQALVATSLFSSVSVEPVRTGNINPDGTEQVNLLINQERGPYRSLAASAGYSTGEGFRWRARSRTATCFRPRGPGSARSFSDRRSRVRARRSAVPTPAAATAPSR